MSRWCMACRCYRCPILHQPDSNDQLVNNNEAFMWIRWNTKHLAYDIKELCHLKNQLWCSAVLLTGHHVLVRPMCVAASYFGPARVDVVAPAVRSRPRWRRVKVSRCAVGITNITSGHLYLLSTNAPSGCLLDSLLRGVSISVWLLLLFLKGHLEAVYFC